MTDIDFKLGCEPLLLSLFHKTARIVYFRAVCSIPRRLTSRAHESTTCLSGVEPTEVELEHAEQHYLAKALQ